MTGWEEYGHWQSHEGAELLKACGIREGMSVLDFGCGIGEYSIPASVAVGEKGKVYAVDKNAGCVKSLKQTTETYDIGNIITMRANESTLELADARLDCVMYFDLYHGMGKTPEIRARENQRIIGLITRRLNAGGLLLVAVYSEMRLIWDMENGPFTPKGAAKATKLSTVEDGVKWYGMIDAIEACGTTHTDTVSGAIHFDEFWKRGAPDIGSMEQGSIYVFRKH